MHVIVGRDWATFCIITKGTVKMQDGTTRDTSARIERFPQRESRLEDDRPPRR